MLVVYCWFGKNVMLSIEKIIDMTLNNVFSLRTCIIEIIKSKSQNSYKLPRMNNIMLIKERRLPNCLQVDELIIKDFIDYLGYLRMT